MTSGCERARIPVLLILCAMILPGCSGSSGSIFDDDEEAIEKPEKIYTGLAGMKCAIMIWADAPTRTEFNQVQVDLARALQGKLSKPAAEQESSKKQNPAPQFIDPRSVVRYQREHPEIEGMPITQVALHLGVQRVVYVELEQLQTQSPRSILLLKGLAKATLRVVEVNNGKAAIAFEEPAITADYPRTAREGVAPNDKINERTIYEGTLLELARKLAARLPEKE